ncbi:MAG: non-heme iron oxygenase ferredoxin subunit [Gammaproteobacteria bacterium]|nr:non-heme iron oxygenase ferredoxin subunit [Gammaproteobacteria bacterium]
MSLPDSDWRRVGPAVELAEEDVMPFEFNGGEYAIYHTTDGFFASAGMCTHESEPLADGIVIGNVIECPLHQGRFDVRTGKALSAPVCVDLKTFPVQVHAGDIYIRIPDIVSAS